MPEMVDGLEGMSEMLQLGVRGREVRRQDSQRDDLPGLRVGRLVDDPGVAAAKYRAKLIRPHHLGFGLDRRIGRFRWWRWGFSRSPEHPAAPRHGLWLRRGQCFIHERTDFEPQMGVTDTEYAAGLKTTRAVDPLTVDQSAVLPIQVSDGDRVMIDLDRAVDSHDVQVMQADVCRATVFPDCCRAGIRQSEYLALIAAINHPESLGSSRRWDWRRFGCWLDW